MLDLVVIGAGLTGLIAAHAARQTGLAVQVIAKGWGATHWSAGTIDVLGYLDHGQMPVRRPFDDVATLAKTQPGHPYGALEHGELARALEEFAGLTVEMGLRYVSGARSGENLFLPSPVGAARPAFLVPEAQAAGDLSRPDPMLIVGLGLRDLYPQLIAENLSKQGHVARAAFLPIDLVTARHDSNTVQLARELDDPARRARLAAEIKKLVRPGERVGLPAILGLDDHAAAWRELQSAIGAPVFEIPTLPPSVPGIRLNNALRQHLSREGVRVDINMLVDGFNADGDHVNWVESETSARPLKHSARNFLLATGGFLGGGLGSDHNGRTWEAVFGLPVAAPPRREEWFRSQFFDPDGHPIYSAGVAANCAFQPVDAAGARVLSNVWVAGSLLAHADPILERSLEGIAVATGLAAAKRIAGAQS